jgi:hypothetical protein
MLNADWKIPFPQSAFSNQQYSSLPLNFMHRVPAEARTVLLDLDLLRAACDLDFRTVIQVAGFGALQPHHFSALFRHDRYLVQSAECQVLSAEL